jgi:hypothetical protein
MSTGSDRCQWCEKTPEGIGPALLKCGSCKILDYCSPHCQQSDWKYHKEECQAVKAGDPMPHLKKAGARMNDEAMLRCNSGVSPTLDPDTIYYTKTSIAAIFDVSFA